MNEKLASLVYNIRLWRCGLNEQGFSLLYRFRYFLGFLLVAACLPLLSLFISLIGPARVQANTVNQTGSQTSPVSYDDPNLITDAFVSAMDSVSQAAGTTAAAFNNASQSADNAAISAAKAIGRGGKTIADTTYSGGAWAAHGLGRGVSFIAGTPAAAWHGVSNITHISNVIKPSDADKYRPPVIDPTIAAEIANSKPLSGLSPVATPAVTVTQWPIHGVVTEEFGVPHWPYQPTHTGIDISDAATRGVTPIKPFKPGRVIAVVHSGYGFGNHVIVDHGGGLLSLYGHMYSTAVQVGQQVDETTTLGLEGSTGVSTGVHVHFEIDLNGQPVNPHLYVPGQP